MKGVGSIASPVPILERPQIKPKTDGNQQIEKATEDSPQVSAVEVVAELPEGKAEEEENSRRDQNLMGGQ